ncbi:Hypothetical protein KNT65_gp274 [Escherichia phage EcS1]|uniref:Uncharacterized protein n=1 Tax=Escherichia phage EcS1 TaxID=2083276 RepID=A0A2Z5ZC56_9CAUD|nr:Hypothetical protein KNT65_gp274 [Escherichia phage EcS1]BBC78219.1 Hypothetical protein [Escherichia phage EcS1]
MFTPVFDTGESLVSINITDYQPTPGINVDGAHLYGTYSSVFSFSGDALSYRIGDELKSASAWEDLPPKEDADLYLWRAPSKLERTFTYTVELIYMYQAPDVPGATGSDGSAGTPTTPPPVQKTLTQVYSKRIVGNWSKWAIQLRNYVVR